jgi:hypothetical protein
LHSTVDAGQQIGFEQLGIANTLRSYWLHVPLNQREYLWEDTQVKRLFHDINEAITREAPAYFLGNIVTIPRGTHSRLWMGSRGLQRPRSSSPPSATT